MDIEQGNNQNSASEKKLSEENLYCAENNRYNFNENTYLEKKFHSTASSCREIYYLQLSENYYQMIYPNARAEEGNYEFAIDKHFLDGRIIKEDEEKVRKFLSIEHIQSALKEYVPVECRYRRRNEGGIIECCLTSILALDWQDKIPVSAIMTIKSMEGISRKKIFAGGNTISKADKEKLFLQNAFWSNVIHDIRTPLNSLIGFSALVYKEADNPEKVRKYLDKIMLSENYILELVNNILDMSGVETGMIKFKKEDCDLLTILNEIREIIQPQITAGHLEFFVDTMDVWEPYVYCDSLRMKQMLLNILSNAVKFSKEKGMIFLRVTQQMSENENYRLWEFMIKDQGIGMAPEFLEKIFEPYAREDNFTIHHFQGNGLGMAITKSIVDQMGGEIEVKSEIGKGTEFFIRLEIERGNLKHQEGEKELDYHEPKKDIFTEEKPFLGRKILLVEDSEMNIEVSSEILKWFGFIVDVAENGQIAVDKLKDASADTYDIVLMDLQMPVLNGYDATKQIRWMQEGRFQKLPIVAMSGNVFDDERKKAMSCGMDAYLLKPFDEDEMKEVFQKFL